MKKKSKVLAVAELPYQRQEFQLRVETLVQIMQTSKDYQYVYQTDPETLDYTSANIDSTSFVTTNAVDGLLANDKYSNLVPSIAESWTVSKDGLTYTYKSKDAKW